MSQPVSRILVIEDEPLVLRESVKGLNAAARSLDNPCGIAFSGVATAKDALAAIESDGDVQAVLVDDKLYSLPGATQGKAGRTAARKRSCRCRRWSSCSALRASGASSAFTS